VLLENLSLGGLALGRAAGLPWGVGEDVRFTLHAGAEPLPVSGRVAWRQGASLGVSFGFAAPEHERRIYRLLRELSQ
jgi:hypothetical protein